MSTFIHVFIVIEYNNYDTCNCTIFSEQFFKINATMGVGNYTQHSIGYNYVVINPHTRNIQWRRMYNPVKSALYKGTNRLFFCLVFWLERERVIWIHCQETGRTITFETGISWIFGTQLCRAFCRAGRRIFIFLSHQDIFHFIQFVFATIRGISDFSPIDRTFTTANIFTNSRHFTKYCPDNKKSGQSQTIRKTFINKVVGLLHAADCLHYCRLKKCY